MLLVLVFSWKGYPVYSSLHTLMMISNNIITHFFIHHRSYLASFFDKTLYSHAKKRSYRVLFQFESFQKPALLHATYKSYTNARMTLECISTLTLNCDQISVALGLQHQNYHNKVAPAPRIAFHKSSEPTLVYVCCIQNITFDWK